MASQRASIEQLTWWR